MNKPVVAIQSYGADKTPVLTPGSNTFVSSYHVKFYNINVDSLSRDATYRVSSAVLNSRTWTRQLPSWDTTMRKATPAWVFLLFVVSIVLWATGWHVFAATSSILTFGLITTMVNSWYHDDIHKGVAPSRGIRILERLRQYLANEDDEVGDDDRMSHSMPTGTLR